MECNETFRFYYDFLRNDFFNNYDIKLIHWRPILQSKVKLPVVIIDECGLNLISLSFFTSLYVDDEVLWLYLW